MRTKPRTMSLERLENREVFAGNVMAALSGGQLQLTGDNLTNSVEIYGTGNHNFVVQGVGTSINGSTNPQTFHVVSDKISAFMGDGNDSINLHDAAINSMYAAMGNGSDSITVKNVTASSTGDGLQLDMGTDNSSDSISLIHDHIFGNLEASLGGGNDSFSMNDTNVDYLFSVDGGAGSDSFTSINSRIGNTLNLTSFEKIVRLNVTLPNGTTTTVGTTVGNKI